MNLEELNKIAIKMVAPGKGILAADESTGTIQKRFDKIGVQNTEENRRDYREMLFRTDKSMREHISGVILYDETLRQKAKDGTPLVRLIEAAGAVPGIKVDAGAKPLAGSPGETITEGLDGLRERFVEYHKLGARFAKWRAVILLPKDLVVAKEFKAGADNRTVPAGNIAEDEMALDVGPDSIKAFENRLLTTRTLVWNGPFGAFETAPFDQGTVAAAQKVASLTRAGQLLSVAGGGDTVAALAHAGVEEDFTYVSTAGGAFLEWLEGKELPGVEALSTK
jgi:hypothetical protein